MNSVVARFSIGVRNPNRLVKSCWQLLGGTGVGRYLFSRIIGIVVPYSGNIGATIVELREGYARAVIKERRRLRNHLRSIHAIALANLAELTANIALAYAMPESGRFIVTQMSSQYVKKARGKITAECRIDDVSAIVGEVEKQLPVTLINADGEVVASFIVNSLIRLDS